MCAFAELASPPPPSPLGVAKLLLAYGANINTHSNEFKESALTLACYKGHLEMVKFLLSAGADQEHKTDEMHTALMEASMDGHVDVARLLLDHGAQVCMCVCMYLSRGTPLFQHPEVRTPLYTVEPLYSNTLK